MDAGAEARLAGMPQTPDEMLTAVSASLAVRTGRSLEQWLALVRSSGGDPRACASPIRRARPGCSRAAGPGRPRTRCRCEMRARWTPRSSGCYGWPTSRTADRGTGKLLANDGLTPLLVPLIWTNAFLNGYSCGGKASRNVCLILGWRSWPHHLVPSILILPRWF